MEYLTCILIVILVVAGAISIRKSLGRRRANQIKALAQQLGYDYLASDDGTTLEVLKPFPLFKKGFSRAIDNIMRKTFGDCVLTVFDYEHETYSPGIPRIPSRVFRSRQTVTMFSPTGTATVAHSPCPSPPNAMMCIESNQETCLIYEPEILHPADDLPIVIDQRKKLYDKRKIYVL